MPILLVDDDRIAAEIQATILRRFGFEVLTCSEGADAIRLLEKHRPRVLLLDLMMPGIDGFDVARELQEKPHLRPKLVIAVTGYGDANTRRLTSEAGFDHHLMKPIRIAELLELLATALPPVEPKEADDYDDPRGSPF
jgi:CheY-like chemotaxis protein